MKKIWIRLAPLAFILLILTIIGSFVAALATADWRWLIITAISFWIFARDY